MKCLTLIGLLALVAATCASTAYAEPHFNLTFGSRDETDSEEELPAAGIAADFGREDQLIRPEIALSIGVDPVYGGNETELSGGLLGYWEPGESRVHFGAGLSNISSDWGANSGSSTGVYVHGGASWRLGSAWIGFDIRYLSADDFEAFGTPFPVGYFQVAVLLGW